MSENKISPYVGPRPFDSEDHQIFFGRDTEVRELQALVSAYADVLLFAQSGAGKSSLINAGLIPSLKGTEIQILDPARVGIQTRDSLPDNVDNIYTYNLISTWSSSIARDNEISRIDVVEFFEISPA